MSKSVAVVGAGIFGVCSAIALAERGWDVRLLDPGPLPHPLAASTDISKIVRADYGADELYVDLMVEAFPRWREWNEAWGIDLYHQTGFLILAGGPISAGSYEHESFTTLEARDFPLERLGQSEIAERFPAWTPPPGVEAYVNARAGWAESGEVVRRLVQQAEATGISLHESRVAELLIDGSHVRGVVTDAAERLESDVTVVAAGAWTSGLVPELDKLITTTGHPIIHFQPENPDRFRPPGFLPWASDIAQTGWYGFPATDAGIVKIANHAAGRALHPDHERQIAADWETHFRSFLAEWIPLLSDAPIVADRLCLYTDTTDGDFLIDHHPRLQGLVVATGGSGHGFKFAPIIGDLVADAVEDRGVAGPARFRWRTPAVERKEPARAGGRRPDVSF